MKKRYLIPVVLFPLLSGCYGNFISKENAKLRIDNIIEKLSNEESEKYVKIEDYNLPNYSLHNKYAIENYEQEKFAELNKDVYFYKEAVVQKTRDKAEDEWKYSITESWHYLKEDENDGYCFYHVTRLNGETNEVNAPVYTVNIDMYKEEKNQIAAWDDLILARKNEIHASSVHVIQEVKGLVDLIDDDNDVEVKYYFRSLNEDSIYIDASYTKAETINEETKTLHHDFEISVENLRVAIYKHYVSDNQYDEQNIEFGARVDKLEPDLTYSTTNKNPKD